MKHRDATGPDATVPLPSLVGRVQAALLSYIDFGVYPAGCELPDVPTLARLLDTGRATVTAVLQRLSQTGHVVRRADQRWQVMLPLVDLARLPAHPADLIDGSFCELRGRQVDSVETLQVRISRLGRPLALCRTTHTWDLFGGDFETRLRFAGTFGAVLRAAGFSDWQSEVVGHLRRLAGDDEARELSMPVRRPVHELRFRLVDRRGRLLCTGHHVVDEAVVAPVGQVRSATVCRCAA